MRRIISLLDVDFQTPFFGSRFIINWPRQKRGTKFFRLFVLQVFPGKNFCAARARMFQLLTLVRPAAFP